MDSLRRRLLLLLGGVALLLVGDCDSSSSHSLHYFYIVVSEPSQGLSQFSIVGFVDDQPFTKYDSVARRYVPLVPWIEEAVKEDPQYWEWQSQVSQNTESQFRVDLATLRKRYNQNNSTGLHVLQYMVGCEVNSDGRLRGGYSQYGYDGEDFITFDRATLTWMAPQPQARITKERWDKNKVLNQRKVAYLEEECVEWLRRYLGYGNETLRRTERPTVKVARKQGFGGQETLICRANGFYPEGIEITWMKNGVDQKQDTKTGGVVPNSDGTYTKYVSIEVDPNEKGYYRCRVEHNSVPEPMDLAWEEPASSVGLIVGVVIGVLAALILAVAGVAVYMKKRRSERGYKATPGSEQGSDQGSDTKVSIPVA